MHHRGTVPALDWKPRLRNGVAAGMVAFWRFRGWSRPIWPLVEETSCVIFSPERDLQFTTVSLSH